jgi:hypothetical protein
MTAPAMVAAGPSRPGTAGGGRQRRLVLVAAATAGAIAVVPVVGWVGGRPALLGVLPGLQPVNPTAAVSLLLLAIALAAATSDRRSQRALALVGAGIATFLGLAALSAELGGPGAAFDVLASTEVAGVQPQRMVPLSALTRLVLGVAIGSTALRRGTLRTTAWLVTPVALLSAMALLGHVFAMVAATDVAWPFGRRVLSPASSVAVLLLVAGLVALRLPPSTWRLVTSPDPAMALARRLLPLVWVVLASIGLFRVVGERAGWYDSIFGVAFMVVGNGVVLSIIIGRSAAELRRQRRLLAEQEATTRFYERMLEHRALELNDDVVQGLSRAWLALRLERTQDATDAIGTATTQAQRIASELLAAARNEEGPIEPGRLRRRPLDEPDPPPTSSPGAEATPGGGAPRPT